MSYLVYDRRRCVPNVGDREPQKTIASVKKAVLAPVVFYETASMCTAVVFDRETVSRAVKVHAT
jgi:hypothetical protein